MDFDQWQERAAIMEFDGGLNRFQAETKAAEAQGRKRWEFINEDRKRNSTRGGNNRQGDVGQPADNMPRMQPRKAQEKRPVPIGDISAGRDRLELLALSAQRGGVL